MPQISFETIITALTVAATFSLLVERLVEALKHIIESGGAASKKGDSLIKRIQAASNLFNNIGKQLEGKKLNSETIAAALDSALADNSNQEADSPPPFKEEITDEDSFEVHSSIAIKKLTPVSEEDLDWRRLQLFYQLSALAIGIVIAHVMDLHLLSLLMLNNEVFALSVLDVGNLTTEQLTQYWFLFVDEILTGLVIAGGSQPIHILLRFLTTRKAPQALVEALEDDSEETKAVVAQVSGVNVNSTAPAGLQTVSFASTMPASPTAAPVDTGGWLPIEYRGGVKPESLQARNHRPTNPNRIIFHHTAMSSNLGFQAVVDEFLVNKGWSTGYHCVIMPDGAIRPFCRWDRVGNHCKGLNQRSLGVAFHGNFHIDTNDNFSNHDGRFGIQQPTDEQLIAGARLIALWVNLYDDIDLNFNHDILPHREAKPGHTVCPGSNFPVDHLQALVAKFHQQWQQSTFAGECIAEFKHRPYLYKEGISV